MKKSSRHILLRRRKTKRGSENVQVLSFPSVLLFYFILFFSSCLAFYIASHSESAGTSCM